MIRLKMAKKKLLQSKWLRRTALALLTAGAINWGSTKLLKLNIVDIIFGVDTALSGAVYLLVTLSAGYAVYLLLSKQLK